jgi:hypothetical protein
MTDVTAIFVSNLVESFKQLNQFVALGLVTSVSALALEYPSQQVPASTETQANAPRIDEKVPVPGGFVPMSREAAQLLLIAICFVAALMASYSLQSVSFIVGRLGVSTPLVQAACTYSSVATGPIGIRIAGAAVPCVLVGMIILKRWWKLKEPGLLWMAAIFIGAYVILGLGMVRVPCMPN